MCSASSTSTTSASTLSQPLTKILLKHKIHFKNAPSTKTQAHLYLSKNRVVTELFHVVLSWSFVIFMNNSTTEHDAMKIITSFHSESTAHSNDISISYHEKIPKICENPLIIDLALCPNFAIFAMCSKH